MFCPASMYVLFLSFAISISTLCLISFDRYYAIIKPLSLWYKNHKRKIVMFAITGSILFSICVALPSLWFVKSDIDDPLFCDLESFNTSLSIYIIFLARIMYILSATLKAYLYSKIINYLKNRVRPGQILPD
ncbi:hypothetical protein TrispH2_005897 [Trichoplax sp. H2]|nr:hypothetical protein TrispH2_005897 [Trichoplax sp. H2]|eukprot:RDD42322.1 hypothetical protein TrispH2_005897 [Trichoplax sp. H2]